MRAVIEGSCAAALPAVRAGPLLPRGDAGALRPRRAGPAPRRAGAGARVRVTPVFARSGGSIPIVAEMRRAATRSSSAGFGPARRRAARAGESYALASLAWGEAAARELYLALRLAVRGLIRRAGDPLLPEPLLEHAAVGGAVRVEGAVAERKAQRRASGARPGPSSRLRRSAGSPSSLPDVLGDICSRLRAKRSS